MQQLRHRDPLLRIEPLRSTLKRTPLHADALKCTLLAVISLGNFIVYLSTVID